MSVDADYIKQEELDASYLLVETISTLRSRVAELDGKLAAAPMLLEAAKAIEADWKEKDWGYNITLRKKLNAAIAAAEAV